MRAVITSLIVCAVGLGAISCANIGGPNKAPSHADPAQWPELGTAHKAGTGVIVYQVELARDGNTAQVWIYLPEHPQQQKLPCVLIAPAGSRLFHGTTLGVGSMPEHLPYVRAGFAVVAYDVDGPLGKNATSAEAIEAARQFKKAGAGVANAQDALDYALAKVPSIDSSRIYAVGHSSAATLSLLLAESEPRISACIAYAPQCDVVSFLGDRFIAQMDESIPGFRQFIANSSPNNNAPKLKCPLFLFHADDDSIVGGGQILSFASTVRETNANVTYTTVQTGNHYESMIQEGIPAGIRWLNTL